MLGKRNYKGSKSVILVASVAFASPAFPQTAATPTPRLTMQGAAENTGTSIIRDALGRPCLDVEAASKPHTIDPAMVDHVVSIKNSCARLIRAKVCYYKTDRCNELTIQGYKRIDTILGTMRGVAMFRYSILQK